MSVNYKINHVVSIEAIASLYAIAGLPRPKDIDRLRKMVENANLTVSAWDGERFVGFARALTDFSFDCYLADLAVDPEYQKQGIGKHLVQTVRDYLGDEVMVLILARKDAIPFYERLEFREVPDAYAIPNKK